MNPANSWGILGLDCDDPEWVLGAMTGQVPKPSYVITNRDNEHVQTGWILKTPVHHNQQSSRKALLKLGAVTGKLTDLYRADPAFQNRLVRNPTYTNENLTTWWCDGRIKGFSLDQLDIPNDTRPRAVLLERSGLGRNVALFESLMTFAGSWDNRESDLLAEALRLNNAFDEPLLSNEIKHTVKSVERYRAQWLREGRYYQQQDDADTKRKKQARGVAKRWANVEERDVQILSLRLEGHSMQAIADKLGITRFTVIQVLSNERRMRGVATRLDRRFGWTARKYLDDRFGRLF